MDKMLELLSRGVTICNDDDNMIYYIYVMKDFRVFAHVYIQLGRVFGKLDLIQLTQS
jgi:hypothetical protein